MRFLLDTCAISEVSKKRPDVGLAQWLAECDEEAAYISVLTVGEIQKGIARLTDMHRAAKFRHWLDHDLMRRFAGRILPVTTDIALTWGAASGEAEVRGIVIPPVDGLIGATALVHNLVVVTRNTADIAATGARTLCPWG
jgi:toxin FitB